MNLGDLHEALDKIAFDCKRAIQYMMESERGINPKVRENTLVDSDIYEDIEADADGLELIEILIHDYYQYIESGMWPGHWVDEKYLLPWMERKLHDTSNELLRAIQGSIYWYGIEPRPFLDDAFEMIDDFWDDWADGIIEIMLADIEDWFGR